MVLTARRVGAAALAGAGLATMVAMAGAGQPEPRVVEVTTERFRFTPAEIRVEAGTPLVILLSSLDVAHGFRIAGTGVEVEVPARGRGTVMVPFSAPPGRYVFECSLVCGAGHAYMRGAVVVEGDEDAREETR